MLRKERLDIQHSIVFDDPQEDTRIFPRTIVLDLDITVDIEDDDGHAFGHDSSHPPCGELNIIDVVPTFYSIDGLELEYDDKDFYELTGITLKYIREQLLDEDKLFEKALSML